MNISVVIPAYNAATTIERTLQSCFAQSVLPFEIIIVNDASTDATLSILESYQERISIINLEINKGVAHARNTGWKIATGDIVAFLDSDDEWHNDKLKVVKHFFEKLPDSNAIMHLYNLKYDVLPSNLDDIEIIIQPFSSLIWNSPVQGSCISVRKNLDVFFDESYKYCEDHEWAIRLSHQFKGYQLLPLSLTKLSRPQLSRGGLSGNQWKMRKGEMRMYSSLWKYNVLLIPLIPFFIIFSFTKYIRKRFF